MARPRKAIQEDRIEDIPLPGQDPEPARRGPGRPRKAETNRGGIAFRGPDGKVASKAALKAQVATEIHAMATMMISIWGIRDPECAGVFFEPVASPTGKSQERLAAIVEQVVEIMARNEKVLQMAATTGIMGQVAMLAGLFGPVAKQIWKAHGPGGHGHHAPEGLNGDNFAHYPAPALA